MLAKGNRSKQVTDACEKHGGFYLGSIGGPAAILAKESIKSVEVVDFESLRNSLIQEAGVALTGSSVVSDHRLHLEMENLGSGLTIGQATESIINLMNALEARGDAATLDAYPKEVVQGLKTEKEWKKEAFEQSRKLRKKKYGSGEGVTAGGATTQDALSQADEWIKEAMEK